jgi:hypothetical protein
VPGVRAGKRGGNAKGTGGEKGHHKQWDSQLKDLGVRGSGGQNGNGGRPLRTISLACHQSRV